MSDNDSNKPVRGISTISKELDEARNDNTYKNAFKALGMAVVCTVISYIGYEYANTIYVWLWILTALAWFAGIGMLIFGKSMEEDRRKKIAALEAELAKAKADRYGQPKASATAQGSAAVEPAVTTAPARPKIRLSVGDTAPVSDSMSHPTPTTPSAPHTQAAVPVTPSRNTTTDPSPSDAHPQVHAPSPTGWVRRTASTAPDVSAQTKFCGHCGKPIDATTKFCGYCGQAV